MHALAVQILRKHALQVMQMLGVVIKGLGDLGSLIPTITTLALRHVAYGVQLDHYELLGRALLGTLEQVTLVVTLIITLSTATCGAEVFSHVSMLHLGRDIRFRESV